MRTRLEDYCIDIQLHGTLCYTIRHISDLTQLDVHLIEHRFLLNLSSYVGVRALILKIVEFKRKCFEMISFE